MFDLMLSKSCSFEARPTLDIYISQPEANHDISVANNLTFKQMKGKKHYKLYRLFKQPKEL